MQKKYFLIAGSVAVVGLLLIWSRVGGSESGSAADPPASAKSALPAAVAVVQRMPLQSSLTIAGEFKPFQEVDVHAKVAGYLRKIYVDVGDHVKEGQTLGVLEIPELAAELAGADATARRAQEEIVRAQSNC